MSAGAQIQVADPLLGYRDRFPILAHTNYLISNSLGAVPAAVAERLQQYYELWDSRGVRAWEDAWWMLPGQLGDLVAPLIAAGPGEVVFQPTVTLAHAVALSCFDFLDGRQKLVTDAMHFPSILYLIQEQARLGADVVIIPAADAVSVDADRLIAAIDEHTAVVCIAHVLFKSAYIHDVAAIAARCQHVGALLIVDGYQAVGTIPVDVRAIGADLYIGGCLKWLCGGPGNAFMWIRPELRTQLAPRLTGWMSHANPFDFAPQLVRRDDAWRFLNGTPAIPALYAAGPGLEILREVGIAAIRTKSMRQTARLIALAEQQGWRCTVSRDPERRGGTVAIDVDHGYEISQALKAEQVLCDYRPGAGIRFSPHFYNSDAEIDAAMATLAGIIESGSWRHFATRSVVT